MMLEPVGSPIGTLRSIWWRRMRTFPQSMWSFLTVPICSSIRSVLAESVKSGLPELLRPSLTQSIMQPVGEFGSCRFVQSIAGVTISFRMSAVFQGLNRDRFDAKLKVTGQAMYAGDHDLPDLAFAYLIQSSISRGQIRAFDLSAAQESPGLIRIFTPLILLSSTVRSVSMKELIAAM